MYVIYENGINTIDFQGYEIKVKVTICNWKDHINLDYIKMIFRCLSIYSFPGCYDGAVYTLHTETGEIWWKFQTGAEVKSSPTVDPVTSWVIVGSHDKHLYALNLKVYCVDYVYL